MPNPANPHLLSSTSFQVRSDQPGQRCGLVRRWVCERASIQGGFAGWLEKRKQWGWQHLLIPARGAWSLCTWRTFMSGAVLRSDVPLAALLAVVLTLL